MEIVQRAQRLERLLTWQQNTNEDVSLLLVIAQQAQGRSDVRLNPLGLYARELVERASGYVHCLHEGDFYRNGFAHIILYMFIVDVLIKDGSLSINDDSNLMCGIDNDPLAHALFNFEYKFLSNTMCITLKED